MRRLLAPTVVFGCLAGLVLFSYGPALFGGGQFAFIDAGEYYYPLHQRVQEEWRAGRWPLWDPGQNAGMPLLGNPTAAVMYPGKLVFALLDYPWAARLYVIGHTLLAFGAMGAFARSLGVSRSGSALAAFGYAISAPMLFLHCNVIYLVGAAWMPLGFRAADRWLRQGRRSGLIELAVVLAMQTLGGDPESAYILGICAIGEAIGLAWRALPARWRHGLGGPAVVSAVIAAALAAWIIGTFALSWGAPGWRISGPSSGRLRWMPWFDRAVLAVWLLACPALIVRRRWRGKADFLSEALLGLGGAAILAALLAAVQVLPVAEFAARSERMTTDGNDVYPSSLDPWQVAGMAWPNVFGESLRINRWWLDLLPPQGRHPRVWFPSLYAGGLTLVLALGAFGFRGGVEGRGWLSAVAAVSLLAGLGEYAGPLWWARLFGPVAARVGPPDPPLTLPIRDDGFLRDGDGSPYGALTLLLPGFRQFRYPAKLLAVTTLAIAALAGIGWDRVRSGDARRARRTASGLLAASVVGLAAVLAARGGIVSWFGSAKTEAVSRLLTPSFFGLLDAEGAYAALWIALAEAAAVSALALVLVRLAARCPKAAGCLAIVVTAADLALANGRYVVTVPQAILETTPKTVEILSEAERADPAGGPFRVHRMDFRNPARFWYESSPERPAETVAWGRDTIAPKYGLGYGIEYAFITGSVGIDEYERLFTGSGMMADDAVASALNVAPGTEFHYFPRRAYDLWGARYFVLPALPVWNTRDRGYASFLDHTRPIYPRAGAFSTPAEAKGRERWLYAEDFQVVRNLSAYPRAWIVHRARSHPPLASMDPLLAHQRVGNFLFANDRFWKDPERPVFDPKTQAWVEAESGDAHARAIGKLPGGPPDAGESVTVVAASPQRVELDALLRKPGLVVLADVYYPGWKLTLDGVPAAIHRTNFLMRGALVPSGRHRLVYTYEPASFALGRCLTAVGLILLGVLAAAFRRWPLSPALAPKPL